MQYMRGFVVMLFASIAMLSPSPTLHAANGISSGAAQTLVSLTIPSDQIRADARAAFAQNFRAGVLKDPRAIEADRKMPGLVDAMVAAALAKFDPALMETMARIRSDVAKIYATSLHEDEIRLATRLYSSPVGRKVVSLIPEVSKGANLRDLLSPAEQEEVETFSSTLAARKLTTAQPEQMRRFMSALTETMNLVMAEAGDAALQAGRTHMARHRAR
jgi:hypothetical protein